jgi:streptogramin lyase
MIVAVDPDAFGGAGAVIAVHPATGFQEVISSGGLLSEPAGLVIAPGGTIFVTDLTAFGGGGGVIAVNPTTGQQKKVSASTDLTRPMGIAMAPGGELLVAYLDQNRIMRVNPANGEHQPVAANTEFFTPSDLVVDPDGRTWVSETDIQGFVSALRHIDADGAVTDFVTNMPPGAVYFGIALSASGQLYAISHGSGPTSQRLVRFQPPDPTMVEVSANGLLLGTFGVAVDAGGVVYVSESQHRLVRIDPASGAQSIVSEGGSLVHPMGIVVAS